MRRRILRDRAGAALSPREMPGLTFLTSLYVPYTRLAAG
jgi:hypothetical protein